MHTNFSAWFHLSVYYISSVKSFYLSSFSKIMIIYIYLLCVLAAPAVAAARVRPPESSLQPLGRLESWIVDPA